MTEEEQIEKIEAEPVVEKEEKIEKEAKVEKQDIIKILSNALKMGAINSAQAREMRQEIGVFQSDFTSKQIPAKVRKKKRKAAKKARRTTLNNGFKGQKVTKGHYNARGR